MEKLKSVIPLGLKTMIADSTPDNLVSTCTSLLEFLQPLPRFQRVIADLMDPASALFRKSTESALDFKQRGNHCFSKGDYSQALSFYCQALRHAPMKQSEIDSNMVAMLFVNRASALHKLGHLEECIRDCNRAIILTPYYSKAWYRRGKGNASLNNYQVAVRDLEVSLNMEESPSGKKHIQEEIDLLSSNSNQQEGRNNSCFIGESAVSRNLAQPPQVILECVSTTSKGRGMTSYNDIPPSSLFHCEEPLAAIVSKSCRETHCHFCFNELPKDVLFCSSCTLPIYCSQKCQELAVGEHNSRSQNAYTIPKYLSAENEKYVMDTILPNLNQCAATDVDFKNVAEHSHECEGAHWSAVLPTDVVLSSRVMIKFIEKRKSNVEFSKFRDTLDFSHNYVEVSSDIKLELHIYAIVLLYCLQPYSISEFSVTGTSAAQLVLLISKVRLNSMAIVRMKSLNGSGAMTNRQRTSEEVAFTCAIEQVRVGRAIYLTGSLFNHSCQPNVHAYFLSRTLFLRSTEYIPARYPLEISYGPQVGQQDLQERHDFLKKQYYFKCQCKTCSELNMADLVLNAFRCSTPDCLGAVPEMTNYEKLDDAFVQISGASCTSKLTFPETDIGKVASILLKKTFTTCHLQPGYCLSCGSSYDLESLRAVSEIAKLDIERFKSCAASYMVSDCLISDAFKSLVELRSVRHPYSKAVAQAEDNLAEAFVMIGHFNQALKHCVSSIKILEKLYHAKHIVIGHELLKLASIQLSLGDHAAARCNVKRLEEIFTLHYGSHTATIFPYVGELMREGDKLASAVEPPH